MPNSLTDPRFAADPPIKIPVDARVLGLVIGILSIVGAIAWLIVSAAGLFVVGSVNPYCSGFAPSGANCGTSGIFALGLIGFIVVVAGYLLSALGGFRMFAMIRTAKRQAIYGLVPEVVGGILAVIGYGGFLSVLIFDVVLAVIVYYLIVVSRFPDEIAVPPDEGADS